MMSPRAGAPAAARGAGPDLAARAGAGPGQRYQTMAQLEYDLAKTLWGRTRAVADLLGLRQPEVRRDEAEAPSDIAARADAAARGVAGGCADGTAGCPPGSRAVTPPLPARCRRRMQPGDAAAAATRAPTPLPAPPAIARRRWRRRRRPACARRGPGAVAMVASGDGRRAGPGRRRGSSHLSPLAVERALAGTGGAGSCARWHAGRAAAPAPSEAEVRAARGRLAVAEVERCWRGDWDSTTAPRWTTACADARGRRRRRCRQAGGALRAALIEAAEAELDRGELEAGVERYEAACSLAPPVIGHVGAVGGDPTCARWRPLSGAGRDTAVRLARQGLAVAGNQAPASRAAGGHAVRRARVPGVGERIRAALAGTPDDAALKRGLDRARKKLGQDKAKARRRARSRSRRRRRRGAEPAERKACRRRARVTAERAGCRITAATCIASPRSPSSFEPAVEQRLHGRDRPGAHAFERGGVHAQRTCAVAGADARLADADVQRPAPSAPPLELEQQPPRHLAQELDVLRSPNST